MNGSFPDDIANAISDLTALYLSLPPAPDDASWASSAAMRSPSPPMLILMPLPMSSITTLVGNEARLFASSILLGNPATCESRTIPSVPVDTSVSMSLRPTSPITRTLTFGFEVLTFDAKSNSGRDPMRPPEPCPLTIIVPTPLLADSSASSRSHTSCATSIPIPEAVSYMLFRIISPIPPLLMHTSILRVLGLSSPISNIIFSPVGSALIPNGKPLDPREDNILFMESISIYSRSRIPSAPRAAAVSMTVVSSVDGGLWTSMVGVIEITFWRFTRYMVPTDTLHFSDKDLFPLI